MNGAPRSSGAGYSALMGSLPDRRTPQPEEVWQDGFGWGGSRLWNRKRESLRVPAFLTHASVCSNALGLAERRTGSPETSIGQKEVITVSVTSIQPNSGVQLLIIVGAAFLLVGVQPQLGMNLLMLGVGAWLIYNIINLGRQF